jgi:hypothetical protein
VVWHCALVMEPEPEEALVVPPAKGAAGGRTLP